MAPVTEYEDYRIYMQDYYNERKRTTSFSWREFTRASGFTSPTYLKLVCEGKTRLSPQGESMLRLASKNKVKIIDGDAFKYFQSWINPVVRELAPVMPGATPGEIAKRFCQVVSAGEVRNSLEFMVRAGLLKKNGDAYEQVDKHLKGVTSAVSVALRYMHREMAHFAEEAIIRYAPSERNFTGLTMGISAEDYEKILQELDVCRKRIAQIALNSRGTERVYRLNLQLFPLTWKEDKSNAKTDS